MKKALYFTSLFVFFFLMSGSSLSQGDGIWRLFRGVDLTQPQEVHCWGDTVLILDNSYSADTNMRYQIKYSYNSGLTWDSVGVPNLTTAIDFVDAQYGWALVDRQYRPPEIYYTTNGGTSWSSGIKFGRDWNIPWTHNNLDFPSREVGYFSCHGWLYKTIDGGRSFDSIYWESDRFECIEFLTEDIGWLGMSFSNILKTTDGGATWNEQYPEMWSNISTVYAYNDRIVFVGSEAEVAISMDKGKTWINGFLPEDSVRNFVHKIQAFPPNVFALGYNLFHSRDGGETWENYSSNVKKRDGISSYFYVMDFAMRDSEFGWIVTNQGFYQYDENVNAEDIPGIEVECSAYPNPFSESTIIGYQLPFASKVEIDVYDAFGRKIINLENGFKNSGCYQAVLEAGDMPYGVYYYTVRIEGEAISGQLVLAR